MGNSVILWLVTFVTWLLPEISRQSEIFWKEDFYKAVVNFDQLLLYIHLHSEFMYVFLTEG